MNARIRAVLRTVFGPLKRKCEAEVFWMRRHIVLARDLRPGVEEMPSRLPVEFRFGSPEDLDRLDRENHNYDGPAKALGRRRLAAGNNMVLGLHGSEVVFHAWLMYGRMDLDSERIIPATPDKVYSYDVFTSPRYRGHGICPAYYCHFGRLLREQGYGQLFCQVISSNKRSLQAHLRAGLVPVGSMWEVRLGRKVHYRVGRRVGRWLRAPGETAAGASPQA